MASCLTTDAAFLRKKDALDNLVSCLTTDVASLRKKDVLDNVAYVCNNDANDHMTPDLERNVTHVHIPDITHTSTLAPISSLLGKKDEIRIF